jgi:DNA primase
MSYNDALNSEQGEVGLKYLESRGFSKEFCNEKMLGFSPKNSDRSFLYDQLINKFRYTALELLEIGVLRVNIETRLIQDYIGSQRIVFPVIKEGQVIGLSARSILPKVQPRYMTHKYKEMGMFNQDVIKETRRKVYITEGAIDCCSLLHMGFHATGIIGLTSFGREQADLFQGFMGDIVIITDNDKNGAGQRGMTAIGNLLYESGLRNISYKLLPRVDDEKSVDLNDILLKEGRVGGKFFIHDLEENPFVYSPVARVVNNNRKYSGVELDILDCVLHEVEELRQEGPNRWRGLCPFHADSEPSFIIYTDNNRFKCFGCNISGNAIDFLTEKHGCTPEEAIIRSLSA